MKKLQETHNQSKRSANNSGSIRERQDGRWEARVSAGNNPITGKPVRKSIYGKSQNEVRRAMTKAQNEIDEGMYISPQSITVAEWLDEWLETFCLMSLKPYTVSSYHGIIENHIKPYLGAVKLQAVKGFHVQRFYNHLMSNGLSPKTVKNIGAILHKAFNVAIRQEIIHKNPCDAAELPKCFAHEIKPLTDGEIPVFLKLIKGNQFENAFALCLFAGLREGECLGLSWSQVDFNRQEITINQQLQKEKKKGGQYYISRSTKSGKPRTIVLPSIAFNYLKLEQNNQRIKQVAAGKDWENKDDLVFTNNKGRHIAIFTFYKAFKAIAEKLGRPDLRPHDLRHTAATVAIASGADVKSVQKLLGHATAKFTLDIYTHASEKMMADTALRLQNYYQNLN